MKLTSVQLVVCLALLGVMAFLVTFARQVVSNDPRRTNGGSSTPASGPRMVFLSEAKVADPVICDFRAAGSQLFLLKNVTDAEVEVGAETLSCKCQSMSLLPLTEEEEKIFMQYAGLRGWMTAPAGALPWLCAQAAVQEEVRKFMANQDRWQFLSPEAPKAGILPMEARVPARSTVIFRMGWDKKRLDGLVDGKSELMSAKLWTQQPPRSLNSRALLDAMEVSVQFLPPLGCHPKTLTLPATLNEGAQGTVSFLCWTTLQSNIALAAEEIESKHPCFECTPIPISIAECRKELGEGQNHPVASAYRMQVTVHENRQGKHLDIGPFSRRLVITMAGQPTPVDVEVNGTVLGEVRLVAKTQRINFGEFDFTTGTKGEVILEADRTDTKLTVASVLPEYLNVDLTEMTEAQRKDKGLADSKKYWSLKTSIPANRAEGKLPRESAIMLNIAGAPRAVRIPVVGHATFNR